MLEMVTHGVARDWSESLEPAYQLLSVAMEIYCDPNVQRLPLCLISFHQRSIIQVSHLNLFSFRKLKKRQHVIFKMAMHPSHNLLKLRSETIS